MLGSVSWNQYITCISLLLVSYYAFVGYKYYRWELLSLIGIKKVDDAESSIPVAELKKQFATSNHSDYLPKENLDADISPLVQAFTDEVKAFVSSANSSKQKKELLYSLELIISKYPVLKDADCKEELVNFVKAESNTKYPNLLEHEDIERLWM